MTRSPAELDDWHAILPIAKELEIALSLHQEWLGSLGSAGRMLVLDVDLSGGDLTGRNLAEAQLPGVVLNNATLIEVDLYSANLASARLVKADLSLAILNKSAPVKSTPRRRPSTTPRSGWGRSVKAPPSTRKGNPF